MYVVKILAVVTWTEIMYDVLNVNKHCSVAKSLANFLGLCLRNDSMPKTRAEIFYYFLFDAK